MRRIQVYAGRCQQRAYAEFFSLPPFSLCTDIVGSVKGQFVPERSRCGDANRGFFPLAEALARIFDRADGKQWDYVFNCGGETRYSQEDEVYKLRTLDLSLALGKEAAKRGVKAFVELSTGMVYKPDSSPSKEQDRLKPWSKIAIYKLQAEEELAKIEG